MAFLKPLLTPQIMAAYVVLALIVGILGRNRQVGFWGFFLLSMLVTPFVTGFFMIINRPRKVRT
jgi:hypothetical protein